MPARPSFAPRRIPGRLALFRLLPQHEIERILLGAIDLDALAGAQLVERLAGEPAVTRKLAHRVIDVAVRGLVGKPALLQHPDHVEHALHVLRRARLDIGFFDAERRGVLVHRLDEARGQRLDGLVVVLRAPDDLVVDIGDIAHVGDFETRGAQPAPHHVEHHHHPRMAQMAVVVDGHAAHVHAHLAGGERHEIPLVARQRIVDFEHGSAVMGPAGPGIPAVKRGESHGEFRCRIF